MMIRWIGAAMILASGGSIGFAAAWNHRRQEAALEDLIKVLDFLWAELNCRLTPLPQLCREAAKQCTGVVGRLFQKLGDELDKQLSPDAQSCMKTAIESVQGIPECAQENLLYLGKNLGRFDLQGQLAALDAAKQMCARDLCGLRNNRDSRLRSYQALGFCAGAALVILLI